MYINKDKIKITRFFNEVGDGAYGRVYKARYKTKKYAYKKFYQSEFIHDEKQILRLEKLCATYDNSNLLLPKYLIEDDGLEGYLMDYYYGKEFLVLFGSSLEKKIKYLRLAKELIQKINEDYEIVHSDIHFGNILFNDKRKTVALADFDAAKIDGLESEKENRLKLVNQYLKYNDYDKSVDIYTFNLLTFALINEKNLENVREYLTEPKYITFFDSNAAIKTLEDMNNFKKNENYLIDMINEEKVHEVIKMCKGKNNVYK